jgi:4'-phosphopantetheinyl transferase EntD
MHPNALTEIQTAVRRLLPAGITSSAGPIADAYPPLAQAELAVTGRMRSNRLQEFSAGRAHARTALQELGLRSPVVPVGADRAPLWPPGFVGSISHAGKLALAVAAPCTVMRAIGVDLEPSVPLDMELLNRVCRPEELARLQTSPMPPHLPLHQAKLIFSAKESVYKCVAPLMGIFLEFADLEILIDTGNGKFCARGHGPAESLISPDTVTGRFAEAGGYWVTIAWQRPQSGQARIRSRVS